MDNILVTLPSKVSDEAMNTSTKGVINVGKSTIATSLFEMFVSEDVNDTKVERIRAMTHITHVEFSKACKDAQEKADWADAASGFKAAPEAKGTEKYGPARRVLNQRLSEAKQIFGVAKLQPTLLAEKGYWGALDASRTYLGELGIKWDNSPVLDAEEKDAKRNQKLQKAALAEVMDMYEQQAGENIWDYMERMASKVDQAIEEKQQQARDSQAQQLVTSLVEKHGSEAMVNTAVAIIEQYGDLQDVISYFSDLLAAQEKAGLEI